MERSIILVGRLYKSVAPTKYFFKVLLVDRFMPLVGVSRRPVESPLNLVFLYDLMHFLCIHLTWCIGWLYCVVVYSRIVNYTQLPGAFSRRLPSSSGDFTKHCIQFIVEVLQKVGERCLQIIKSIYFVQSCLATSHADVCPERITLRKTRPLSTSDVKKESQVL